MAMRNWFRKYRTTRRLSKSALRLRKSLRFEPLEARNLLSGTPVGDGSPEALFDFPFGQTAEYSIIGQSGFDEIAVPAKYVANDLGDFYYTGSEKIPLLRYADQFLIKVANESTVDEVFAMLSGASAPLTGYRLSQTLDAFTFIASADLEFPSDPVDAAVLAGTGGVPFSPPRGCHAEQYR